MEHKNYQKIATKKGLQMSKTEEELKKKKMSKRAKQSQKVPGFLYFDMAIFLVMPNIFIYYILSVALQNAH